MFWSAESKPGFFRVGLIMVTFSEGGTVPVDSEELIMAVIREVMEGRYALTSAVEIGSR